MARLRLPDGSPRPKGKPRGNPAALIPYYVKPGERRNPAGMSKARKVSEAIAAGLGESHPENPEATRAAVVADQLLRRAEKDTKELEVVLRITEPQLAAQANIGVAIHTEDFSVMVGKLFKE